MIYNNILEAMGHTPLIKLNHMIPEGAADIFVKFEGLNVGGSIKTRTAPSSVDVLGKFRSFDRPEFQTSWRRLSDRPLAT